jgi:cell division protein FtsI (penicillin-binding protein 3)
MRRHAVPKWAHVKVGEPRGRLMGVGLFFSLLALVLVGRAFYYQGLDLDESALSAENSLTTDPVPISANRGTITDRDNNVLAASEPAVNVITDQTIVSTNGMLDEAMTLNDRLQAMAAPGVIAGTLLAFLDVPGDTFAEYYDVLSDFLTDEGEARRYGVLATEIPSYDYLRVVERLDALGYTGLYSQQAPVRVYPTGSLAANVVGYMNYDDYLAQIGKNPWSGAGGLEASLNTSLAGVDGAEIYQTTPHGRIPTGTTVVKEPVEGVSYQLTLDSDLQFMVNQRLARAVAENQAESGMAITLDVKTGEILAMANYPTFDPDNRRDDDYLGNRTISVNYEPGSVQKILTMAALADQGIITPQTKVSVPAYVDSGGYRIYDAIGHGDINLTVNGIVARSSNIGTVLLARQMEKETFRDYLLRFGLNQPTGVELPDEESGDVKDLDEMTDWLRDRVAFGQGVSVTALQEAAAVAAIVNGGVYTEPHIVKQATQADGSPVELSTPQTRQVVSPETSEMVRQMMEAMTQYNGFTIDGYRTGAKSGTAERYDSGCACYHGYIVSFIGVAPIEDPRLLTYVVLDLGSASQENPDVTGSQLAAPVYTDIMRVALPRYGIPTSVTAAPRYEIEW